MPVLWALFLQDMVSCYVRAKRQRLFLPEVQRVFNRLYASHVVTRGAERSWYMTRAPHLTFAMAKDSNSAQRRSNKARQQAKGKKLQANAPKNELKPSELETSTAPPKLDKQDTSAQLVLEQRLHTQEDQIAALRQKNEALEKELKETQQTLQESHRAFADQMVGISASFDQDKERVCGQVRTELDQVRAELGVSQDKERSLTQRLHELENKIQTDTSAALSPFTALKDIQAQLHVRLQRLTQRRM